MANEMRKISLWVGATLIAVTAAGIVGGRFVAAPAAATREAAVPAKPARAAPEARPAQPPADPDAYVVRRILRIDGPFRHGDYRWDETGVPAGRIVITVDLAAQMLSVFRDGYEIGAAPIIYGADEKPTPLGVFNISQKSADHVSNLYDAPMPYMMRLTNDGISIHGSAAMRPDAATHGCVGLPIAFARKLFGVVTLGDRVIVSNGETLKLGGTVAAAR